MSWKSEILKSGLPRFLSRWPCEEQLWACQALSRCNLLYAGKFFVLASCFEEKVLHAFASSTRLRSGTILKIEFRNVVGELVLVLNLEFQAFVGVLSCIEGRRVVFATGHLQAPCAVERLTRVDVLFQGDEMNMFVWRCFLGCFVSHVPSASSNSSV